MVNHYSSNWTLIRQHLFHRVLLSKFGLCKRIPFVSLRIIPNDNQLSTKDFQRKLWVSFSADVPRLDRGIQEFFQMRYIFG